MTNPESTKYMDSATVVTFKGIDYRVIDTLGYRINVRRTTRKM